MVEPILMLCKVLETPTHAHHVGTSTHYKLEPLAEVALFSLVSEQEQKKQQAEKDFLTLTEEKS